MTKAGAGFEECDIVQPKIARIRIYSSPASTAKPVQQPFQKGGEAVVEGKDRAGASAALHANGLS